MKRILVHFFLIGCCLSPAAQAAETEIELIKRELAALVARVEQLEAENSDLREASTKSSERIEVIDERTDSGAWTSTIALSGDVRYRYESIDVEGRDTRERNRVRARVAIKASPTDNLKLEVGLASGSDDPLSTNQTLGDAGSTKDLRLDLAYFKWQATPNLAVQGGKMKNSWYRPRGDALLWDNDFRPEGLGVNYARGDFFMNSAVTFLESDTRNSSETIAYGLQGGYHFSLSNGGKLTAGMGYLGIGTEGKEVVYGDPDDFFGNTFSCANPATLAGCVYDTDFNLLEVFAEASINVGELPVRFYADFVTNQDADRYDTGWATGFQLGRASGSNTWELGYVYQDLEANAVLGLTTDSDFGGGGTDVKGHILRGAWAINKKWRLGMTYFRNENGVDLGAGNDYERLQLDTAFRF